MLGNTIPTGAILVVIITIFGPVSGAHFNPAVTLVFATRGEMPWSEVLLYVVVQCAGGIAGTIVADFIKSRNVRSDPRSSSDDDANGHSG